jgi:hypothetical protein
MATNTAAIDTELAPKLVKDMMAAFRQLMLATPSEDASATLTSWQEKSQTTD